MAVQSGSSTSAAPPPPESAPRRDFGSVALGVGKRLLTLREGSIIVVTLIAIIYFASSAPNFLSIGSFKTLLPYFAPFAIIAAGEVFVMILGEIDLSVGAMYLFTPFLWHIIHHAGIPMYPSIILALLAAMALGAVNGFAVAYIGIASFVATLGMLFVLDGLTLIISHATQVTTPGTSVSTVGTFAQVFGGGTYSELFWAIGIVVVLQIVLSFTRWGLYTVAVGGNRLGAAEAGIRVRLVVVRNFVLCAGLAGFVGILEAVRVTTATPDPSGSNDILFQAVSAVIIGGTLMTGGEGTVVGAMIGAIFLGVLHDGLIAKSVSANYLDLYLGIAILIAMVVNVYVARVRRGASGG
jgi:simple sugar transport system permease protein